MKRFRFEHYILLGFCCFLLGLALTVDYHRVVNYLFSDEAVYYMMAQSLAFDQDLEYTQKDLQRVYKEGWHAGPQGVYLTKAEDGRIYYGKYLTYSLFLAPFIALFGFKGFLVLNGVLLCWMIWMAWLYLRQFNPEHISLLVSLTFFILSASFVYTFWLTPEVFNMFCVTLGLFFWLYKKEELLSGENSYHQILSREQARYQTRFSPSFSTSTPSLKFSTTLYIRIITTLKWLLKTPDGRLYLAPIPIAIACASKITNVLFFAPILVDALFTGIKKYRRQETRKSFVVRLLPVIAQILILCILFGIFAGMFFGLQYLFTGNFNQYAGDRRMFIGTFPFNAPRDVWEQGIRHSNEDYYAQSFFFSWKILVYNCYYYLVGRFTGMFPYFLCSFLALYYFARRALSRSIAPRCRGELLRRVILFLIIGASIAGYIIMAPINYHGGSGAFGNRFFLNIYPAFLFLITAMPNRFHTRRVPVSLVIAWIIGSLFLAQALINPFQSSYYPAAQAFKFPYRFLPVELTMINAIPTHVNPHLMQVANEETPPYRLYFVDENAADIYAREFWVQGEKTVELVVFTYESQSHLVVTVTNGPIGNQVDVSVAGKTQSIRFGIPREKKRLVFPLDWSMPYFKSSLYPVKIRSHTGFVPKFTAGVGLNDWRFLGARVQISLNPLEVGRAYLENGQPQKALAVLESEVKRHQNDIYLHYYLGIAYQQAGMLDAAIRALEFCKTLLPDFREALLPEVDQDKITQSFFDLADFLQPLTHNYEAAELSRTTGEVFEQQDASNGKAVLFNPTDDPPGFLVYGQYEELPAGQYQVKYRMKIEPRDDVFLEHPAIAAFFDVYSQKQGTLEKDSAFIEPEDLNQTPEYRAYALNFEIAYPTRLEFRVETTGQAKVAVDNLMVYPRLPLQIYQASADLNLAKGKYEDAYRDLQHVIAVDAGDAEIQNLALQTLIYSEQWEKASDFIKRSNRVSNLHTGIVSSIFESKKDLARLQENSPNLYQFLEELYSYFSPEIPLSHCFGERLALLGYDVTTNTIKRGDQFSIQYYWKALKTTGKDYSLFVHFTKKGALFVSETISKIKRRLGVRVTDMFQQDHEPLYGAYPTSKWLPGELIREQYEVIVPPELKPGTYEIWIGVWNPLTKTRLTTNGKTKVKIGEIQIN